ncbi:MAG: response regulator transcription factor [Flavobacteriaceae bacterium]|jgi:DNA-binding NarL/FixJ family response regulator|nr:response regulator transcription factor [Flavobacteriaceae bacterium]
MIKIALVDDHQLFRKSLSLFVASFEGVSVIFDTDDGIELTEFMDYNDVDLVLLDIQMPKMDGYEICALLKEQFKDVKILIVSQLTTKEAIHKIMELGANGFFTKNSPPEQLELAIRSVMEKDYYFDMELASVVREAILWERKLLTNNDYKHQVNLTSREVEIIKMACREMNSIEIGDKLCISTRTVEKHRNRIMEKTNSKNFIGVVLFAIKSNYILIDEI